MSHFKLTIWLWRHLHILKKNNAFIINSELLKKKYGFVNWLDSFKNSRIHIEFQAKLFIGTRNGLKTKMIKFSLWIFFLWNFNQMVVMNFWKVKIELYFQKSFWNEFLCLSKFLCPNEHIIEISIVGFYFYGLYEVFFYDFQNEFTIRFNNIFNRGFHLILKGCINE